MAILTLKIDGQSLSVTSDTSKIVEKSINYLKYKVEFANEKTQTEWEGLDCKVLFHVLSFGGVVDVDVTEGFVPPGAAKTPGFMVSVLGYKKKQNSEDFETKILTNPTYVPIHPADGSEITNIDTLIKDVLQSWLETHYAFSGEVLGDGDIKANHIADNAIEIRHLNQNVKNFFIENKDGSITAEHIQEKAIELKHLNDSVKNEFISHGNIDITDFTEETKNWLQKGFINVLDYIDSDGDTIELTTTLNDSNKKDIGLKNAKVLNELFDKLKGGETIYFPKGIYHLTPSKARNFEGRPENQITMSGNYYGIKIIEKDNLRIIFDKEAQIKTGLFDLKTSGNKFVYTQYANFSFRYCNNIEIIGGIHIGEKEEHKEAGNTVNQGINSGINGIEIRQCKYVNIRNMEIYNWFGDGILVGVAQKKDLLGNTIPNSDYPNQYITIEKCCVHDCMRNGITYGGVYNGVIEQCEIYDIYGANPQSLIDLESEWVYSSYKTKINGKDVNVPIISYNSDKDIAFKDIKNNSKFNLWNANQDIFIRNCHGYYTDKALEEIEDLTIIDAISISTYTLKTYIENCNFENFQINQSERNMGHVCIKNTTCGLINTRFSAEVYNSNCTDVICMPYPVICAYQSNGSYTTDYFLFDECKIKMQNCIIDNSRFYKNNFVFDLGGCDEAIFDNCLIKIFYGNRTYNVCRESNNFNGFVPKNRIKGSWPINITFRNCNIHQNGVLPVFNYNSNKEIVSASSRVFIENGNQNLTFIFDKNTFYFHPEYYDKEGKLMTSEDIINYINNLREEAGKEDLAIVKGFSTYFRINAKKNYITNCIFNYSEILFSDSDKENNQLTLEYGISYFNSPERYNYFQNNQILTASGQKLTNMVYVGSKIPEIYILNNSCPAAKAAHSANASAKIYQQGNIVNLYEEVVE